MQKSLQDVQAQVAAIQVRIQATTMDLEQRTRQKSGKGKAGRGGPVPHRNEPAARTDVCRAVTDYDLARQNYSEMVKRHEASDTAQNLEEHKAGQNLEVLDPASLPEAPRSPTVSPLRESAPCWG